VFPETIVSIGSSAFADCKQLTSVTFNKGKKAFEIGEFAFCRCENLVSVQLSDGLSTVGKFCFNGTSIKTIVFPETIVSIGSSAFADCKQLTSVTFNKGNSTLEIDESVFYHCGNLVSLQLSDGLSRIGNSCFAGTGIKEFVAPAPLKDIGSSIFEECKNLKSAVFNNSRILVVPEKGFYGCTALTKVLLPTALMSIRDWAFYGCENLGEITLPANVSSIGRYAFSACMLTELTLPDALETVGEFAFGPDSSLRKVSLGARISVFDESEFLGSNQLSEIHLRGKYPSGAVCASVDAFGNADYVVVSVDSDCVNKTVCGRTPGKARKEKKSHNKGLSKGAVAGITAAGVSLVAIIVIIIIVIVFRRQGRQGVGLKTADQPLITTSYTS
jgi:hypothetical protein